MFIIKNGLIILLKIISNVFTSKKKLEQNMQEYIDTIVTLYGDLQFMKKRFLKLMQDFIFLKKKYFRVKIYMHIQMKVKQVKKESDTGSSTLVSHNEDILQRFKTIIQTDKSVLQESMDKNKNYRPFLLFNTQKKNIESFFNEDLSLIKISKKAINKNSFLLNLKKIHKMVKNVKTTHLSKPSFLKNVKGNPNVALQDINATNCYLIEAMNKNINKKISTKNLINNKNIKEKFSKKKHPQIVKSKNTLKKNFTNQKTKNLRSRKRKDDCQNNIHLENYNDNKNKYTIEQSKSRTSCIKQSKRAKSKNHIQQKLKLNQIKQIQNQFEKKSRKKSQNCKQQSKKLKSRHKKQILEFLKLQNQVGKQSIKIRKCQTNRERKNSSNIKQQLFLKSSRNSDFYDGLANSTNVTSPQFYRKNSLNSIQMLQRHKLSLNPNQYQQNNDKVSKRVFSQFKIQVKKKKDQMTQIDTGRKNSHKLSQRIQFSETLLKKFKGLQSTKKPNIVRKKTKKKENPKTQLFHTLKPMILNGEQKQSQLKKIFQKVQKNQNQNILNQKLKKFLNRKKSNMRKDKNKENDQRRLRRVRSLN